MASKYCTKCQLTKSVNDFNKKTAAVDGFQTYCKSCSVEVGRKWNENNRERLNARNRNNTATNPQLRIGNNKHQKLRDLLRRGSYTTRTLQIIGLSKVQFLDWISYNFEGDMIWSNHGSLWQFDIVIPASALT